VNLEGKTLAVTGAAGFIGTHAIAAAHMRGMRVRGLDLAPRVGAIEGVRRGVAPEGAPAAVDYLSRPHPYSTRRAREHLGYRPQVFLEEGMARVAIWAKAHGLV
jgi:nucleoside-diphosphate-sugar epimerase